jgi:hypothetical protein
MAITATRINDRRRGFYPRIAYTSQGLQIRDFYQVDEGDLAVDFYAATGLPAIGDAYPDAPFSAAVVREYGEALLVSGKKGATANTGRIVVPVIYRTGSFSPLPEDGMTAGEAFHVMRASVATATIGFDTAGGRIPQTAKEVSRRELLLYHYMTPTTYAARLAAIVGIEGKTNADTVAIPPLKGTTGSGFTAAIGELLARPATVRPIDADLVEVVFAFGIAPDWLLRYRQEDQDGTAVGAVQTATIYDSATFSTVVLP